MTSSGWKHPASEDGWMNVTFIRLLSKLISYYCGKSMSWSPQRCHKNFTYMHYCGVVGHNLLNDALNTSGLGWWAAFIEDFGAKLASHPPLLDCDSETVAAVADASARLVLHTEKWSVGLHKPGGLEALEVLTSFELVPPSPTVFMVSSSFWTCVTSSQIKLNKGSPGQWNSPYFSDKKCATVNL